MKKPEELKQTKRLFLNVLAPIHIGTREGVLRPMDYIIHDKHVYIVDENKLGEYLLERGLLPRLLDTLEHGPLNLAKFLKEAGASPGELAPRLARLAIPGGDSTMQEFRPLIRDGQGLVYLPGTAIKGVIRTAILYKLMRQASLVERVKKRIEDDAPCQGKGKEKRQKTVYYSDALLQKQVLQNFTLPPKDIGRDPTTDILRCLTVRDAYPVDPKKIYTGIIPIDFLSKRGNGSFYFSAKKGGAGRLRLWLEAILMGTFVLELIWNNELFGQFQKHNAKPLPVQSLEDVLAAVQEMNQDVMRHEISHYTIAKKTPASGSLKDALKDDIHDQANPATHACLALKEFYESKKQQYFRLGFGSGMISTTVNLHLPPEFRQKIRDNCGSGPRPGDPAPKSRRIWLQESKGKAYPLGWLQLLPREK
jgi:CRISPR-associated protein Csm5